MNLGQRIEPNLVDRVVSFIDPVRGARRMRARAAMTIAGGYLGARKDRRATKEWRLTNNSADADTLPDLPTLPDRSRDLVRNAPLATGAIGTVVQNVVGTGLSLQAKPDWEVLGMTEEEADEWTAQVEREFRLWAESTDCDLTRTQNFYGLQEVVFRWVLESGDVFILLPMVDRPGNPYSLRLQVIEADRVETPLGMRDEQRTRRGTKIAGGVTVYVPRTP